MDSWNQESRRIEIIETRVDKVAAQVEEILSRQKDMKDLLLRLLNPNSSKFQPPSVAFEEVTPTAPTAFPGNHSQMPGTGASNS